MANRIKAMRSTSNLGFPFRTAEKEIQELKKKMKLESEKIREIKFFCGIGYVVAVVFAVCLIVICFL